MPPFEAWYIGSDGVETLDMLAYPRWNCCAAVERGLSGATRNCWQLVLDYCIDAAKKTDAMNMQGYHRKGVRKCAGYSGVLRSKGHLDVDLSTQNVQAPALCSRGHQRRSGGLDAISRVSHCQVV